MPTKVFVVTLALVTWSLVLLAADNSVGTWKRNSEKSTNTNTATPITELTMKLEAIGDGRKQTVTGTRKDGTPVTGGFTAKYDGKEYPVTGSVFDRISIRQIDANTFDIEAKSTTGKHRSTTRMVVSADGTTMTYTAKGVDANGKAFTAVTVYDRQ